MRTHILLAIVLSASTSCRRDEPTPPAELTPARAAGEARALEPSQDVSPIAQRLAWEARHRPERGITAEQAFDAFARAGVPLRGTRQYLGVTMQASYCAGGVTPEGVAISVCEYATPEAAEAGKGFMDRRFAAMTPHTNRVLRGNTLLSIALPSPEAGSEVSSRAVKTFTSM